MSIANTNRSGQQDIAPATMKASSLSFSKVCVQVIASIVSAWLVFSELADNVSTSVLPAVSGVMRSHRRATTLNTKQEAQKSGKRNHNMMRLHNLEIDQSAIMRMQQKRLQRIDQIDSPFESIWPGEHLPPWAMKSVNYDVTPDKQVCFVHVGKAGGSTIGCNLGFSLHCENSDGTSSSSKSSQAATKGFLPIVATHTFHRSVYNCNDDSAYFLFVIRDPIDRARSAFYYDRPEMECDDDNDDDDDEYYNCNDNILRKFYVDCPFYYFEDFVQNGLTRRGQAPKRCKRMANDSLKGKLPKYLGPSHFYYNYQYYLEAVPEDAAILVIRNEHIEKDWSNLETMLGESFEGDSPLDESEVVSFPRNNANTRTSEEDLYLSEELIATLCHALCNEIQIYKKILGRAQNIDRDQLGVSLAELESKCPIEAVATECPEPLPNSTAKLEQNRGYHD